MINVYEFKLAHPETFSQISAGELLIVHYLCPQRDRLAQLFTHFNQLAFTLGGHKWVRHGDLMIEMTENKSFFMQKTAYTQEMTDSTGWEVLAFYFPDEFLKETFLEFTTSNQLEKLPEAPKDMLFQISVNERVKGCLYGILPYFKGASPPDLILKMKFRELLFALFADPENDGFLSYCKELSVRKGVPIREKMEANYMYNLSINDYARLCGCSQTTFKREFTTIYKTSPGKWLRSKRLEHARYLLLRGDHNISEAAFDSGFENLSHFSRVFKEQFGISPNDYRKQNTH